MGFDKGDLNFNPNIVDAPADGMFAALAEHSIVRTICEGSGGPDCEDMTDPGLRFVRYLLSISKAARFGFLPNFKDPDTVRDVARQFIKYCGSASLALQTMRNVVEAESA
ncbi:MAG: hypothetical protein U0105_25760 [Candidatus Obscuribacterales bacterium]